MGLCSLLLTFALGEEKANKPVNSTGYNSSLTYSMILSPGGREGSGNIANLPTMRGTRRERKSQHWAFHPTSPNESFPLSFQIRLTIKRDDYSHPQSIWTAAKSLQSCPTLCDPIDGSPPGAPVPGILQARTLEWVAIAFSNAWKWKVKVKLLSRVWLSATPWTIAFQASPSMAFSRQEYWSGVPLPSQLSELIPPYFL